MQPLLTIFRIEVEEWISIAKWCGRRGKGREAGVNVARQAMPTGMSCATPSSAFPAGAKKASGVGRPAQYSRRDPKLPRIAK